MSADVKEFLPVQEEIGATEALQEAAPKRRRGRPPKDSTGEAAPKRTYRKRGGANLETRVGAFIIRCNIPLQIVASMGIIHPDDPLSVPESMALAKSLTAQAALHPTFRRYLETAMSASDGADLIFVLGAIGLKRAANHGAVPESIGNIASAALANPEALAAMFGGPEEAPAEVQPTPDAIDRAFAEVGAS